MLQRTQGRVPVVKTLCNLDSGSPRRRRGCWRRGARVHTDPLLEVPREPPYSTPARQPRRPQALVNENHVFSLSRAYPTRLKNK